jgi:hypothetical protein
MLIAKNLAIFLTYIQYTEIWKESGAQLVMRIGFLTNMRISKNIYFYFYKCQRMSILMQYKTSEIPVLYYSFEK